MEPLDGNAIAGTLTEYFGAEMTIVSGTCHHCGASSQIAELRVYTNAPGPVARCPACGNVVIVLMRGRASLRVDSSCFQMADRPEGD